MATDSSSGTLPSSSRLTIDSSSSSARSKESFFTSVWVFSAISRSRVRRCPGAESNEFLRTHCGGNSPSHQHGDNGCHPPFLPPQGLTPLPHPGQPAARAFFFHIHLP